MCLNWDDTVICHDTLKSHKTVFILLISYKMTKFEDTDNTAVVHVTSHTL